MLFSELYEIKSKKNIQQVSSAYLPFFSIPLPELQQSINIKANEYISKLSVCQLLARVGIGRFSSRLPWASTWFSTKMEQISTAHEKQRSILKLQYRSWEERVKKWNTGTEDFKAPFQLDITLDKPVWTAGLWWFTGACVSACFSLPGCCFSNTLLVK